MDYLRRMDLGDGIAMNESLLENVFVLLVCILNKIPVFLVGKPGCSKSLSFQLIVSNLKGQDSKGEPAALCPLLVHTRKPGLRAAVADQWFKTLPMVQPFSYQGSENSTSQVGRGLTRDPSQPA
jgi:hypothetical protein